MQSLWVVLISTEAADYDQWIIKPASLFKYLWVINHNFFASNCPWSVRIHCGFILSFDLTNTIFLTPVATGTDDQVS